MRVEIEEIRGVKLEWILYSFVVKVLLCEVGWVDGLGWVILYGIMLIFFE